MTNSKERYGVDEMTFEEQMKLWETQPSKAKTRNNKIRLCTAFEKIRLLAEHMENYSKTIPEEDNEKHAERVQKLTDIVETMWKDFDENIYNAIYYG